MTPTTTGLFSVLCIARCGPKLGVGEKKRRNLLLVAHLQTLGGMFVRNALGVMLVAKGENQLALAPDSRVLVSVLDLVRMIPPTASNMI
jgi:hypothetical protein